MSTLIEDGSRAAGSLISIFSFSLLSFFPQPSGDDVLSRNGLYSLLAKMSFPKGLSLLSCQSRQEIVHLISDNGECMMCLGGFAQNDVWIFVFISLVDKLQVLWYRCCRWTSLTFLWHDKVQISVYRCQGHVRDFVCWGANVRFHKRVSGDIL